MTHAVFEALADPTRRRLLELLADGDRTAGELAGEFSTARPTVSRHLRVLREAGLVGWRSEAQQRVYHLVPASLAEAGDWVDRVRDRWSRRLDQLEHHLDRLAAESTHGSTPTAD
ncbi:ArsR family transcriptional regulator [Actinoalloteichus sp. AHMU CJ021]|uniref:DNA-binding transcriptional regulator, ArsR family n=1 Tax=Actinoalloteichus caeruleus DSM 43889 TaxID=1120930 RepID=A0ABT1JJT3_ACTCY|nr:metalloregulator ArsR/SmtB family transcription factor [Actinoalloteichus caeruleus]AUS78632.1 ArsR family transcriptional regulator [Actinoalloteichus sp. AHMU CJ021]MCP2332765.1 DNA-binding transcriptional regulator, ArsR family [Actinoalloteichus caeruleus DSM 43889]